jgi:hypothetical protein
MTSQYTVFLQRSEADYSGMLRAWTEHYLELMDYKPCDLFRFRITSERRAWWNSLAGGGDYESGQHITEERGHNSCLEQIRTRDLSFGVYSGHVLLRHCDSNKYTF